jgi:hypothetical protein
MFHDDCHMDTTAAPWIHPNFFCLNPLPCVVLDLWKKGRKIGEFSSQDDINTCKKCRSGQLTDLLTISCQNVTCEKIMCIKVLKKCRFFVMSLNTYNAKALTSHLGQVSRQKIGQRLNPPQNIFSLLTMTMIAPCSSLLAAALVSSLSTHQVDC